MGIFLAIVFTICLIALTVFKKQQNIEVPKIAPIALIALITLSAGHSVFNGAMFYAEPGFVYHVRTITGDELVVDSVGYSWKGFGRVNAWKKAITVQATNEVISDDLENVESDSSSASASLPTLNIMFLDQVDADAAATARFRLPTDKETFLEMTHEYRTPENLLRTALVPAFKETLQATGSLMSAEEYYAGGRTEFNTEFDNQMANGIYLVKRIERQVEDETASSTASANASRPDDQQQFGDKKKVVFVVEKQLDETGTPLRKRQKFVDYGIQVVEARITDMQPNNKFIERMQLKQKASADRAIAREQRIQEEEQRLLAIAKGEREVAERQAEAKVEQIQKTTEAETEKQLALTSATQLKETATIAKETAALELEKAKIDAQRIKALADAEAYKKQAVMRADNALAQKLEAEIAIQKVWAEAYAKRQVPTTVLGGGENGASSDSAALSFMQLLTLDAAKRLSYNRDIDKRGGN